MLSNLKLTITIIGIILSIALMAFIGNKEDQQIGVDHAIQLFYQDAGNFTKTTDELKIAIDDISDKQSIDNAKTALINCRRSYKSVEYFMEYFFKSSSRVYNSPAKLEVEEPELEYQEPIGFQQIEALLCQPINTEIKKELQMQVEAVQTSAHDIKSLLYKFKANDQQILESLQLELIRIMTLGISGYDAPTLKSGIMESYFAMISLQKVMQPYLLEENEKTRQLSFLLFSSIDYLKKHQNFDGFDRMTFLRKHALPLQRQIQEFIRSKNLTLNTTRFLNYDAKNIFDKNFLNVDSFSRTNVSASEKMVLLGKELFFDKNLSNNLSLSCASCHQPDKYFTDGLPKSISNKAHQSLNRNTPSLSYSAYQLSQDWGGETNSLKEQILKVMTNENEMASDTGEMILRLLKNEDYVGKFKVVFKTEIALNFEHVAQAMEAYIKSLAVRNSLFDQYMNGDTSALNPSQIKGFNLFMGKAQCGTCHFAPVFNGLTPPYFDKTEYEILGVPQSSDFVHPKQDEDLGRYNLYPTKYYKRAFKTPSVRNSNKTAPYMHNGSLKTIEQVIDFYNKGGGNGLGLHIEEQTLPSVPLNLSKEEVNDIVSFLAALNDVK